ncbi:hypothetical protein HDU99_000603 [Rhizoclosmatium hyalinum]|nr:hypothetical protein HDU99_000603 [Rhizoclosmatium hyalinum]
MAKPQAQKKEENVKAKKEVTYASLVRVSAIGCLLSSVYVALIAGAELSDLGSVDASVMVTKYADSLSVKPPGKLVAMAENSFSLHIHCVGSGKQFVPTIILETGLAVPAQVSWSKSILGGLESIGGRVCWYDRAGYGFSDSGPMPQTAKKSAAALYELLKNSEEQGPFVLVGHSYGGFIVRLLADAHPEQIAGIVLIDSTHETVVPHLKPYTSIALQTAIKASLLNPFAALDRYLLRDAVSPLHDGLTLTPTQTALTFQGKFWKAISNEILNLHNNASVVQVARTVPRIPRSNLPVAVVTAIDSVSPYCTPNKSSLSDQFTRLADTNPDTICRPITTTAPKMFVEALFKGQWKLATELSDMTRFSFMDGSHAGFFVDGSAAGVTVVEAVESVVKQAGLYMRGEYLKLQEAAEEMRSASARGDILEDEEDEEAEE